MYPREIHIGRTSGNLAPFLSPPLSRDSPARQILLRYPAADEWRNRARSKRVARNVIFPCKQWDTRDIKRTLGQHRRPFRAVDSIFSALGIYIAREREKEFPRDDLDSPPLDKPRRFATFAFLVETDPVLNPPLWDDELLPVLRVHNSINESSLRSLSSYVTYCRSVFSAFAFSAPRCRKVTRDKYLESFTYIGKNLKRKFINF